ncbi:MAG: hypothetical protein L0226_11020 [Acidobacteria bacterium]|nr:hypothetical protein [Acidobacteriota bacterium]
MNTSSATTHPLADPSIEIEVVLKALEQAAQPVTAKQLRDRLTGPFKMPRERLCQLLEEQVSSDRIYRYAPRGRSKQPRYWSRSLEEFAREMMLNLLAQRPRTQSELLRKLKSKLSGFDEERQIGLLTRLLDENQVQTLPPFIGGRTTRYGTKPPDPRDYIEDAIARLSKKLKLSPEEILDVMRTLNHPQAKNLGAGQNDLSEKLLARMVQVKLAAAPGGLVPLNDLWRSLQNEGWDKSSFDRTVLGLAEKYRVSLQRHNFPYVLSEQERAELVADERGNYYVGIELR